MSLSTLALHRRHFCIMTLAIGVPAHGAPALPRTTVGRLVRWETPADAELPSRPVDIWLPPGYPQVGPCAVVYMHDGQMLFDAGTTWNRQAWNVQEAIAAGMASGRLPPTIVVGVHNREGYRYAEYYPEKALARASSDARQLYLDREVKGQALADAYLRLLVKHLKPRIDAEFHTRKEARYTSVVGASMGGLISLYALAEYPDVFGAAGGLSTHWIARAPAQEPSMALQADLSQAFLTYLEERLPAAGRHRLWVDRGDDALDSQYAPGLERFGRLLKQRKYSAHDAVARTFPGTGHQEQFWSQRVGAVLEFLHPVR